MKKMLKPVILASSLFLLAACAKDDANKKPEADEVKVTVSVKPEGEKADKKEVIVDQDDSVLEALDEAFDVEDDNGFVTEIEGHKQDPAKNLYWMYKVNGKMANKGAEENIVKDGDKIEFYQEVSN
ncbi:DUF4430 domain-containing protein [Streptococcus pluranimalium]|uniref:Transcobalamin-like C-terminal domain-containing protein n=1 Tax=Streptococcus pluranimalium TaxID=82348 RepID=A0A2L0D5J8_9STRE|nr:DUF4430 domain-containing protein [Streptococcus pluranimalium]AUW96869.1 hypothetical protein C0J00_06955 [Streptococcus pluranimalium]